MFHIEYATPNQVYIVAMEGYKHQRTTIKVSLEPTDM